jgi:hypothetical protein
VTEARQTVARLRALPESTRERLLLRLVEGIPGPEQAQVLHVKEGEVKADLERGAAEAARLLGQPPPPPGDGYLWDLSGVPSPLVARLEMQLPVLRFDGNALAPTADAPKPATDATFLDLDVVGGPMREPLETVTAVPPAAFSAHPERSPGVAEPGDVEKTRNATDLPAQALVNPFEPGVPTVAATELSAAAHGVAPVMDTGASAKQPSPARPPAPDQSISQRVCGFTGPEETRAEERPPLAHSQARRSSGAFQNTETDLLDVANEIRGQPLSTAAFPTSDAAPADDDENEPEPTRMQPMPAMRQPIPGLTARSLLVGMTPFLVAAVLLVAAVVSGWTGLFTS